MTSLKAYRNSLETVIREAGALAQTYSTRLNTIEVKQKSPKDLVTEADLKVEAFIKQRLSEKFPEIGFWGEESGKSDSQINTWIVDPIDGTHSFFRGQYFWSISIALQLNQKIQLGAVYAPALDDLYLAENGSGATRNGKKISVSTVDRLENAMVGTGFACLRSNLINNNLERFSRIALKTRDQRRFGSAALDLCMVADGKLDAFWEQHLNLYDVAAGSIIAREAGATICNFKGEPGVFPEEILATNKGIREKMVALM